MQGSPRSIAAVIFPVGRRYLKFYFFEHPSIAQLAERRTAEVKKFYLSFHSFFFFFLFSANLNIQTFRDIE